MHTGLITLHFAHHYGIQLQALVTMRAIQSLGHDREIIDYRLSHTTRTNQLFKKSGGVRSMVSDAHTALRYEALQHRFRRFEVFAAEEVVLSPRRCTAFGQPRADPPAYDVYVAGSDQVWNPYIFQDKQFDLSFLLGLVREGRRIACAPSLGVFELSEDKAEELRRLLTPFSVLFVREKRGQVLLREVAGRDVRVVLDPTLLLTGEDWGELAVVPKRQGPYILCYFVSGPGEAIPYALALSAHTGRPIVRPVGTRRKIDGAAELVFDAGLREFLGLLRHVSAVVTDPFYGAASPLQFQKDFLTSMSLREWAGPTFSRIYSLLPRLGCASRILGLNATASMDAPIDYGAMYEKLAVARADSLPYLGAVIEDAPLPAKEPEPQAAPRPVLCRAEDCIGCIAYASVRPVNTIATEPDHEGFPRPVIGERCILCHRCEQTCPIFHPPMSGPALAAAHAAWNRDEVERTANSSGGFFPLLVHHVLEQGGAVFGVALDEDMITRHVYTCTADELIPIWGSKYVQNNLGDSFSQVKASLEEGTAVLSSGVPCQMDGFKRYLGRDYLSLFTCDLMCHGVPSLAVSRAYLDDLEAARGSKIVSVRLKDKSHGWSYPRSTAQFADGSVCIEDFNRTGYGWGLGTQFFLRPACTRCRYTSTSRPADFTLADYWGPGEKLALPVERDKGVSVVLVNSARGQAVFDALFLRFGQMECPLAEAVAGNPRSASPLKANPCRAAFSAAFAALPFTEVEKRFLALPSLPYQATAKMFTPAMEEKIRRPLK